MKLHIRATYANVTSTLALVIALSGGAYAVTVLPINSVGTPQLKTGAVTNAKIAANAINGAKVANGSLTLADLAPGQVMRNRGTWLAGTAYKPNDVVQFGGSSYVARLANTGVPTSNTTNWTLLSVPTKATGKIGTTWNFIPICGGVDVATTTVTPTVNSRVFVAGSGYWTPNGVTVADHGVGESIVVRDGATLVGGIRELYDETAYGTNDDIPISTYGVAMTSPFSDTSTPLTLTAGKTYTIALRMTVSGICSGSAQVLVSLPEVSAVLTADQG